MPIFCNACELFLADDWASCPSGPCPKCGFETHVWYPVGKEFHLRVSSRGESRPPGGGPWVYQDQAGDSFFEAEGRMHYVQRIIDRLAGEYHERIIDKGTGEVVREVHESLKDHHGRGSARPPELPPNGGAA